MEILLVNIGTIITSIVSWLGNIATSLISNPIFIILIAVIILRLIYKLILKIIDIINIKKMPYYKID